MPMVHDEDRCRLGGNVSRGKVGNAIVTDFPLVHTCPFYSQHPRKGGRTETINDHHA